MADRRFQIIEVLFVNCEILGACRIERWRVRRKDYGPQEFARLIIAFRAYQIAGIDELCSGPLDLILELAEVPQPAAAIADANRLRCVRIDVRLPWISNAHRS